MKLPLLLLLALLPFLTACAPRVDTTVTRFHTLPSVSPGRTFTITPLKKEHRGSLEFQQYAALIAARLESYGWKRVSANPYYSVLFDCGIRGSRIESELAPLMGRTSGETIVQTGVVASSGRHGGSYTSIAYIPSSYGVIGAIPVDRTVFDRYLVVNIVKAAGGTAVFESRAINTGPIPEISAVMPSMVDALFSEFPGKSGRTEVYRRPL